MQTSPLVSVDMMTAGPPASASAAKTGQDDIFAAHLAAASQEHAAEAPAPQAAKTATKQESAPAADEHIPDSGEETSAQAKEATKAKETSSDASRKTDAPGYNLAQQLQAILSTKETGNETTGKTDAPGYNLAQQLQAILSTKETGKETTGETTATDDQTNKDTLGDLTADAALNGSAGAANAATIPLLWTVADIGFTANGQAAAKTLNNESIMSRMLDAITSAANGTTGAPQTKSLGTLEQAETTVAGKTEATAIAPTDPGVQAISMEAKLPLLPTNQPIAAPGTTETITVSNASSNGTNSIAGKDINSLQPQTPAQQNPAQQGADQVVQNQYGQIITIHQSSESLEMAAATTTDSKPLATVTTSKTLDATNNFIQSHLADDAAPKALEQESSSQQQDTARDNQQKGTNTAKTITTATLQPEQLTPQTAQPTVGTENQSLIFPNQQASVPLTSTPLADSSSMRLPSGLTVPGETVVDQMISHFSVNNRLESGTVNLKLHPQELGELRMELKITQDNIKAHFIAQTPQAQEMITQHLPRLREALEQQGLHLQQVEVTIATNDTASRDQFQGHSGQQQLNQSMHNSRGNQPIFALNTSEDTGEATQLLNDLSVMA